MEKECFFSRVLFRNHQTQHSKKGTFKEKRKPLLFGGAILKKKTAIYYVLKGVVPKNGSSFCQNKYLSCYLGVDMFVSLCIFGYFKLKIG